jgi:UDP-N-acetyl-D-mannosaminuronate dehydrogenase
MPKYTVEKLVECLRSIGKEIKGAKIGLLGLSYKANLGDMRESPALEIRKELVSLGASVLSCDPYCNGNADATVDEVLNKCTGVILCTSHDIFLKIKDWENVKVVVDGRNSLNKEDIESQGIIYKGIGRGMTNAPAREIVNES